MVDSRGESESCTLNLLKADSVNYRVAHDPGAANALLRHPPQAAANPVTAPLTPDHHWWTNYKHQIYLYMKYRDNLVNIAKSLNITDPTDSPHDCMQTTQATHRLFTSITVNRGLIKTGFCYLTLNRPQMLTQISDNTQ